MLYELLSWADSVIIQHSDGSNYFTSSHGVGLFLSAKIPTYITRLIISVLELLTSHICMNVRRCFLWKESYLNFTVISLSSLSINIQLQILQMEVFREDGGTSNLKYEAISTHRPFATITCRMQIPLFWNIWSVLYWLNYCLMLINIESWR